MGGWWGGCGARGARGAGGARRARGVCGGLGSIPMRSKRLRMREYQRFLISVPVLPGSRSAISDHLTEF